MSPKNPTNRPLDRVTASIVYELEKVNLFHYNKLVYLFEYFYIKNFGKRFTQEKFIKLPHGPVITDYKKQIGSLAKEGFIEVDSDLLNQKRMLGDDYQTEVNIFRTETTQEMVLDDEFLSNFLHKILYKYGTLSTKELEAVVYRTPPMINLIKKMEMGFKKNIGGYVLADCIRFLDYKNPVTEGRRMAIEHLKKYPFINFELHKKIAEELSPLKNLRPEWAHSETN
ncbi:MAG: type II toxin-antitoxin system antitoxin SocA domain-containing protein [Ignavibacteriaceae bacterium]|jgi:uncharacterized phage-associated protein